MSGEQAEERTMTKHTDSSRSTDSGVSGNAQRRGKVTWRNSLTGIIHFGIGGDR
jgi:hypothetical protein